MGACGEGEMGRKGEAGGERPRRWYGSLIPELGELRKAWQDPAWVPSFPSSAPANEPRPPLSLGPRTRRGSPGGTSAKFRGRGKAALG